MMITVYTLLGRRIFISLALAPLNVRYWIKSGSNKALLQVVDERNGLIEIFGACYVNVLVADFKV